MKPVVRAAASAAAIYSLTTFGAFMAACRRFATDWQPKATSDDETDKAWQSYAEIIKDGADWYRAQEPEEIVLRSYDGLKLRATLLPAEHPKGIIIAFHGYRSAPLRDMGASVQYYHGLGYSLLLPCQRACAESGGKYITFGVRERRDVKLWADWTRERFGPDMPIVLAGISLGAASVLMSLELSLPGSVRAVVADCGYGSVYQQFKSVLKALHIPPQPMLWGMDKWCRLVGGFGMDDCSVPEIMKTNRIPVLFIHGEADSYVPTRFSRENYQACAAPKALFTVPGAGHGLSYLVDMEGYHRELEAFLNKYCRQ
jgi:fermentation-respiration switch protein FrsA (DUF1100 family)